jgi:hypothetical protein
MVTGEKRRTATIIQSIFGMLVDHPEGLLTPQILEGLERLEGDDGRQSRTLPSWEQTSFRCVAPIRAGWLSIDRHHWTLSEKGREAYRRFQDPEQLMIEAGRLSARGWLSVHFPRSYSLAGRFKDQITSEVGAARRIGFRNLLKGALARSPSWQEILPLQKPQRIVLSVLRLRKYESFREYLDALGVDYREGGHAIYLPPNSLKHGALAILADRYPPDAGIKIIKKPGTVYESDYVSDMVKGDSALHLKFIHGHLQLTMVANLLYSQGLGPRLYDLVELDSANQVWTAYVIQHIDGGTPSLSECEAGIERLRRLDSDGILRVIPPEGFSDLEFQCPTCVGNALVDDQRAFKYVDFQNFFLADYESYLTMIAEEASEKSHFGDESVLRGGKYLYQQIPGVRLPGKRGVTKRILELNRLMESCGVSVENKMVLDVGCNIGMMIGQYLKLGAKWCHGWDRSHIVPHTEKLLLALGCTRFSTTGGDISQSQPMELDLPEFIRPQLDGCVISYLAVRAHVGWLKALGRIPWSFLIYEGHEGETQAHFEADMKELRKLTDFQIGAVSDYVDGDSDRRTIAILVRRAS